MNAGESNARKGLGGGLGPACLLVLGLVLLSGLGLSFHYFPTADIAHESVRLLEREVAWGGQARSLHHYGALAVVGLMMLQLAWLLLRAGYRGHGRWGWWTVVALLFVVVLADVTGGLLPWDERALHATDVRLSIVENSPLVGAHLSNALRGSDAVSAPTLVRFYAIHLALVPLAIGAVLLLWRRSAGRTAPPSGSRAVVPALLALFVASALLAVAWELRAPLGHMAAPGEMGFEARPEWYMLWLFELLRLVPPALQDAAAYGLPGLLTAWLLLVPLVDRGGSVMARKVVLGVSAAWALLLIALSIGPLLDWPDNREVLPQPEGLTALQREGYLLVRTQGCADCHSVLVDGEQRYYPPEREDRDTDVLSLLETWTNSEDLELFEAVVRDPYAELMTDDMPSYDHLTAEQIRAIAEFVKILPE